MAWLEKRRCAITLGRKASCSLTTLGILMESSVVGGEEGAQFESLQISNVKKMASKTGAFLTLFIVLVGAAESVLGGLA